jgi:tRNA1Val (adenine37-N6)-methyltransferase
VGVTEVTEDGFLAGRVRVRQFAHGFRAGLDAVMLAAAVPARLGDKVLELGSGAGVASLCLASRVPGCSVLGVEIDHALTSLANDNAAANGLEDRVRFVSGDVVNMPSELRTAFQHVLCNPPFHDRDSETSPDEGRALALKDTGNLSRWIDVGVKRTASNGTFTMIVRADRLHQVLCVLGELGVRVFPLWPKANAPAKRVLVQWRHGTRAPFTLLPGLVLHEASGQYTPEADAVLRNGLPLSLCAT